MKLNRYIVCSSTNTNTGKMTRFFVTDATTVAEMGDGSHPEVAEFPISPKYPQTEQEQRANMFRDYMNKIVDATETAYLQTLLCDILKS
jgi:hypothetical protein